MRGTRSSSGSCRWWAPSRGSTGCRRPTATTSARPCGCGSSSTSARCASRRPSRAGSVRRPATSACASSRSRGRTRPSTPRRTGSSTGVVDDVAGDDLVALERRQALREALAELPGARRELLLLLLADPPVGYAEISERLGIPVGSIGPTRARAFDQLRKTRALRAPRRGAGHGAELTT